MNEILTLTSPLKEKPYGGNWLYERFHLGDDPYKKIGEYWAISAHDNGPSIIANGPYKGKPLKQVFKEHRELFANSTDSKFPLLVKINELDGSPSVQVHPDDAYAKKYSNDLGKAEFCLYIDVVPGTKIVRGHTTKTKEEFLSKAKTGKWDDLLIRKPLHKNDFVYTPPGIVHGSEGHLLMAEVQQSSDVTFRIYDYDNTDANGNPRETHLEQAAAVTAIPHREPKVDVKVETKDDATVTTYVDNEFFRIRKYTIDGKVKIDNPLYSLCLVLKGNGQLKTDNEQAPLETGHGSIITSECKEYEVEGNVEVLISEPPHNKK